MSFCNIPDAMTGTYPRSLEDLVQNINPNGKTLPFPPGTGGHPPEDSHLAGNFLGADTPTKQVLVNKPIERIEITNETVKIRFKIDLDGCLRQPGMALYAPVPEDRVIGGKRKLISHTSILHLRRIS